MSPKLSRPLPQSPRKPFPKCQRPPFLQLISRTLVLRMMTPSSWGSQSLTLRKPLLMILLLCRHLRLKCQLRMAMTTRHSEKKVVSRAHQSRKKRLLQEHGRMKMISSWNFQIAPRKQIPGSQYTSDFTLKYSSLIIFFIN